MLPKKTTQTTKPPILPNKNSTLTVFVALLQEVISHKAQMIAQKGYSWDELNWIIGENEVKLTNALEEKLDYQSVSLPHHIPVITNKINKTPPLDDIKKTAEIIASHHLSLPQLQWDLALQDYILEEINIH